MKDRDEDQSLAGWPMGKHAASFDEALISLDDAIRHVLGGGSVFRACTCNAIFQASKGCNVSHNPLRSPLTLLSSQDVPRLVFKERHQTCSGGCDILVGFLGTGLGGSHKRLF